MKEVIGSAAALAMVNERLIEYIAAPLAEHFGVDRKWLLYVQLLAGLGLAFVAGADLMAGLGIVLAWPVNLIVSGLVVGGGSELLHQILELVEAVRVRSGVEAGDDIVVEVAGDIAGYG